jgi:hypothetical protein
MLCHSTAIGNNQSNFARWNKANAGNFWLLMIVKPSKCEEYD